jgi:hypothetical protein
MTPLTSSRKNCLWLALAVAACAVSWTYRHRVLLPWEYYVNVTRGPLHAQMGDLYSPWVGSRDLLLEGRNPYSADVSHEIQMAFYGHAIDQSYDQPASEIKDEQRFAYPVYAAFLLAPVVHSDFARLQQWAPVVLGVLVAASVWFWMGALGWKPPPAITVAVALLVLSSPQIEQGLRLRQLGLFVAFLLALASWCAVREQYFVAGILLAVSTIKPQMVALCLLWFLIWTIGDWKKRWTLAAGLCLAMGILIGAGEWLVSGWLRCFLQGLEAYRRYVGIKSMASVLLGNWAGGVISVLAGVVLLNYAWKRRRADAKSPEFVEGLSLFLIAGTLILPLLHPYNQVVLLLPVVILIRDWRSLPRWAGTGFILLVAWPYVTSLALLLRPPDLDSFRPAPLLPSLLTLLTPFLVFWLLLSRRQGTVEGA